MIMSTKKDIEEFRKNPVWMEMCQTLEFRYNRACRDLVFKANTHEEIAGLRAEAKICQELQNLPEFLIATLQEEEESDGQNGE